MASPSELHADIGDRLCQHAVRPLFIERRGDSIIADFLIADKNLDPRWIEFDARSSDRRENAPPIRIGSGPRSFHEHRMGNRARDLQRLFPASRSFYRQSNHMLHPLTIA